MKIIAVIGARPNFVKIAALEKAFRPYPEVRFILVHTGQHYDPALNEIFFRQLDIPAPDFHLGVGSDSASRQLGNMLLGLEPVLKQEQPDLVLVVGDTTSALAGALAASRVNIPVAHVEAGLRSGDRSMPEEINRIITDSISDFLFVTEQAGLDNLGKEGLYSFSASPTKATSRQAGVFFSGNCMIDTLLQFRPQAALTGTVQKLGLSRHKYALATLHRPSNVDTAQGLKIVINILETVGQDVPVIFPLHPRTASNLEKFGLMNHWNNIRGLQAIAPQGYLEFLDLLENTALVLTDSGGIQDETTFLQIPCLTLRTSTERPVTITTGTNELVSVHNTGLIRQKVQQILSGQWRSGTIPEFWDGQSARRIAEFLINTFHSGMNGQGFCLPEKKN